MEEGHDLIDKKYFNEHVYTNDTLDRRFINLNSSFQKYRISKVLQIYKPNKKDRVLDLGCGWGTFCFIMAPLCNEVTGIDFSSKSIELCNKLLMEKEFDNISFICADAQNTGLESESYDVIICADLFVHLYPETFKKVLDECERLLKNGGKLVIFTSHRGHIFEILKNHNFILKKDISYVDYKSANSIINELKIRHFLIEKMYYTESHVKIFNILERLFLRFLPMMRRRIAILAIRQSN